jgi:trehalose 6-phosphate synthase
LASNRGPVSFVPSEDGHLTAKRGGGGLVSGLSSISAGPGEIVWVCSALSDGDRAAAGRSPGGRLDRSGLFDQGGAAVRMLAPDPEVFHDAYNGVANSTLWFIQHLLYATPTNPAFGPEFRRQWASFEAYNRAFAEALAEEAADGASVLVQDYHLCLVPGMLRELRPDLRIGHFSHTPWAPEDYFRMLPDDIRAELLAGMLGADRVAFLTWRWATAFLRCAETAGPGRWAGSWSDGEPRAVGHLDGSGATVRETRIGVHGLGADAEFLRERSHREDVGERMAALREEIGADRRTIVRVDRTELSKNIVRGLLAYRQLLDDRPEWRERVVHVAFAYPSRQDLAVYRDYTAEVQRLADEINSGYGTPGWTPVVLHVKDDFARSLAAYRLADVALVNPIRDGMNLVAKEVPVVSDEGCVLVLSREAGAYEELGEDAITVNPYDITGTARALHEALVMQPGERAERTKRLTAAATALPPTQWFLDQLHALES